MVFALLRRRRLRNSCSPKGHNKKTSKKMSFTVVLPLLAGGLTGYAAKKTEKSYFYEQAAIGGFGYTVGLVKALAKADKIPYFKGAIPAVFLMPAAIVGGSLYAGRLIGHVGYDAFGSGGS